MRSLNSNPWTVSPQQQEYKLARRDAPPVRVATDISWLPGEIRTFLSLVTFGHNTGWDNLRRISVALKNKPWRRAVKSKIVTTFWPQLDYSMFRWKDTLNAARRRWTIPSNSRMQVGVKRFRSRTPEEKEVWNWRCTLQKTFIKPSTAANQQATLEPRSLSSDEVEAMSKLFLEMESFNVSPRSIKSTSIKKVLKVIKDREDEFGIKAKALYIGWKRN
ncbi:hypothetical protein B0H11DRAFT_1936528 [Mycena galericulata]|nr:hypothetical protein B0H11DRAFT_1941345 [Mycena galericulata]KAJ7436683.1 hypothetical protein B0H11DRAFT_1936528 [Mycena galericulata]